MNQFQEYFKEKFRLSPRQLEIAMLVFKGATNPTIAQEIEVTEKTVKYHLGFVFKKTHVKNRKDLCALIDKLRP